MDHLVRKCRAQIILVCFCFIDSGSWVGLSPKLWEPGKCGGSRRHGSRSWHSAVHSGHQWPENGCWDVDPIFQSFHTVATHPHVNLAPSLRCWLQIPSEVLMPSTACVANQRIQEIVRTPLVALLRTLHIPVLLANFFPFQQATSHASLIPTSDHFGIFTVSLLSAVWI